MTVKTPPALFPRLLSGRQYSGMVATLVYNWPIFAGITAFSFVSLIVSLMVSAPWSWLFAVVGLGGLGLSLTILLAAYVVYDWGEQHEYDRLAELGQLNKANVVVDITCGKLRGTRGLLHHFSGGHYFLVDIFQAEKMTDLALKRARELEPPLEVERRIYRRTGQADRLPIPPTWADVIFCNFSLHELQDEADRAAIFKEFSRMLKPTGRLLMAEHGRDWRNFIAFGPGAMTFFTPVTWESHFAAAGLVVKHYERWRGLVHLWVIERKLR